ncbi:hypothetical protein [Roseomonas mucosa]|uniref:hypothetical protein n=1 Tax=Roseomonas mucosa TaxID=207340 RepID=UPI001E06A0E5|nr:hypothetical protein [Roseomonas mucosa]MBS5905419.1 hypothetical protein [Acetobacteraceae bacterium]MCG7353856.1 hypothetical protein [Roseomonas mucosa]
MRLSCYMFPVLVALCLPSTSQAQSAAEIAASAAAQVRASTSQLREACARLPQPGLPAADTVASPWRSEEAICEHLADPAALMTGTAWFFGIFGAVLMAVGMLAFAFLGGTLRRLWLAT